VCTFVFALLVLFTTRVILSDISDVLMERVPRSLDVATIMDALCAV
jgi:zinc transporter 2